MRTFTLLLAAAALAAAAAPLRAQQPPPASPAADPRKPEGEKKPEAEKEIDEYVKEYQKLDGVLTLYRKKKGMADTVLMELGPAQRARLYLLQATAATGLSGVSRLFQGAPLDDIPVRFDLAQDEARVLMVEPDVEHRAPRDAEMERTARRTYPDTLLGSFEIKARQKSRDSVLVDVTEFFKSDIPDFSPRLGGLTVDRGFTFLDSVKNFPENLVIRTRYRLARPGPAPAVRGVPFAVSYNLSVLPDSDSSYRPRRGDARVGYFQVHYTDLSNPAHYDRNVNLIQRWRLEKADPSLALSPPKKPMVWYLDNGIPKKWRAAVREGLLLYNRAFEAIGIKDAIEVRQMPDDADWDIADVRYNLIRFTDGQPFAIALFRADPYTGEILNATINFDAAFLLSGASSFDFLIDPAKLFARPAAAEEPAARCSMEFAQQSAQDAQLGLIAATLFAEVAGVSFDRDAYIGQYVTEVVAHEMGHCLGLRHNFIASTAYSLAQLADPKQVREKGVTTSVMDYTPFNMGALGKRDVPFFSQVPGVYDYHAIRYGYALLGSATPEQERAALGKIAARSALPGLAWQSDGVADSYDPAVARFDLSSDPLEFAAQRMRVSQKLLTSAPARAPQNGQSYFQFTRNFVAALNGYLGVVPYVTRYIGGAHLSDAFKGDPGGKKPFVPLTASEQKRALELLRRNVFSKSLTIPKESLALLAPNPNNPGSEVRADARRYPVMETISEVQVEALAELFSAATLQRVAENEARAASPTQTLTLATLYRSVGAAIWSELTTGGEIEGLRRNLQRAHLDALLATVKNPAAFPRDAVTLTWEALRSLRARIAAALPAAKGEYGKAHLGECLARIDRALRAGAVLEP